MIWRGDSMRCRDCPYGIEDFTTRIELYKSVHGEYPDEDRADESERFVWCDKVGGKVYCFGHCTDWYEQDKIPHKNHSKKKRMNKRERYLKHQNHLKYLYEVAGGYYPSPVKYTDEIWVKGVGYVKNPKSYYQRLYRGKRSKCLKQQSNRKIRRYKGELHKGNMAHKLYDFWWEYC